MVNIPKATMKILRKKFKSVQRGSEKVYRSFGGRRYVYAGTVAVSELKSVRRKQKDWYIRVVPFQHNGKTAGYHLWLGGKK